MKTVKLQFRAENLERKDLFGLGKSSPYLIIKQKEAEVEKIIYQTEYLENQDSPKWKPFHLNFEEENPNLKIEIFDRKNDSQDDIIGEVYNVCLHLSDLLKTESGELCFNCPNPSKKSRKLSIKSPKRKINPSPTLYLKFWRKAVEVKLVFSAKILTPLLFVLTRNHHYLVIKERAKNETKYEEIFKSKSIRSKRWGFVRHRVWVVDTIVQCIENPLKVQIFKHSRLHRRIRGAPQLIGSFETTLTTLLERNNLGEITNSKNFQLVRKGSDAGMVSLQLCNINLPEDPQKRGSVFNFDQTYK